ncbi:MAG TPA: ABC transporter transmembrane domain-containing protein [Anaerolineaceae bacterium]|nr:ABC transporter transmembrane domain-containing protein [Anaerolineaceae bacterium]
MGFYGAHWFRYLGAPEEKPRITWTLLRRVMTYSKPYRWQIVGMLLMILATTGIALITPLILRDLIDRTIPSRDVNRLIRLALALLAIPAISGLVNVWQRRLNAYVGEGVIFDLRTALFSHLQRMSLRFFTHTKVGELMSRLNNDVIGAQNAISNTIVNIVTNIIQAVAFFGIMLSLEWRLTLISIAILPFFILAARLLGERLRQIARKQLEANAQMNAMANETLNIGGALLVKLFGRTSVEVDRFRGQASSVRDAGVQRAVVGTTFFVIIGLLSAVGSALVYGLGGYFVIQGAFTIGTIVAFGAYLGNLYAALQGLATAPVDFATSIVSFERVFEVIDLPLDIQDRPDARPLRDVEGRLAFDDVSFRYEVKEDFLLSQVERLGAMDNVRTALSGSQPARPAAKNNGDADQEETAEDEETRTHSQARVEALDHISFQVEPGQLVALVGPSGAGKTTMTYLIPRLYDPTGGRVLIDGQDLRDVTLDSLSEQIGMVTQETHLFHDTIRTNLLYARLDATRAEIESAAKAANIHDFILDLPDGYDTVVGERGYRLSGGEKQRIALARVILKNPRILVLDEATSSLDSQSEALIQEALKRVMAGRTSVVIAHRLSTILAADLILVLDRGRIIERGAHADLLRQGGLYAHLYTTQFKPERLVEG